MNKIRLTAIPKREVKSDRIDISRDINIKYYMPTVDGSLKYLGKGTIPGMRLGGKEISILLSKKNIDEIEDFLVKNIIPTIIGIEESEFCKDNQGNLTRYNNMYECIVGAFNIRDEINENGRKSKLTFIPKSFKMVNRVNNRINIFFDEIFKNGDVEGSRKK